MLVKELAYLFLVGFSCLGVEGLVIVQMGEVAYGVDYFVPHAEILIQQAKGNFLALANRRYNETRTEAHHRTG